MPAISVIIPTYNHGNYVLETLASVFDQSFGDYETIVVNDGSPDDTVMLLAPLAKAGRIRYFEQANAGQAAARNVGLANAAGEYIAFLDDDDVWPMDKLECQIAALRSDPQAVLAYGQAVRLGTNVLINAGALPEGRVWDRFLERNYIASPGQTLIRSSILKDIGGFDTQIWGADDWELYIRLANRGTFVFQPRVALHYRIHASNASRNIARMKQNIRRVHKKHVSTIPPYNRFRARRQRGIVWGLSFANDYRKQGRDGMAFLESLRTLPWIPTKRSDLKSLIYLILPDRVRRILQRLRIWNKRRPTKDCD